MDEVEIIPVWEPDPNPVCVLYPCAMHPEGRLRFSTEETDFIIRSWYTGWTIKELSEEFRAHRNTIARIVNGDTHAQDPAPDDTSELSEDEKRKLLARRARRRSRLRARGVDLR